MSTGWNCPDREMLVVHIINLLGNEYWLEQLGRAIKSLSDYKPTGK